MDNSPLPDIDDILDLTDSEASSSSSNTAVFDVQKPFVLELHDLVKDDPTPQNATAALNIKKLKKKKKELQEQPHIKSHESDSSATISETSSVVPSVEEASKEEYFDAHESYHTMPGFPPPTTVTTTSQSTNPNNPKVVQTTIAQRPPPARSEDPTPTDKPVTPPD